MSLYTPHLPWSSSRSELAQRRIALGLTQGALAKLCGPGVSVKAVSALETGRGGERYVTAARVVPEVLAALEAAQ